MKTIPIISMFLFLFLASCASRPSTLPGLAPATPRTISVSGSSQVMVVPDEVVLTLGVETSALQLAAAKAENDAILTKVLNVTRDLQIDPKYVQTDYMSIEPRYDGSYAKPNFIGYFVRKNIVITLKDITKFEDLLSLALGSGVNYVHGVDFRTTDLRKYRDQARALAIQAAQEKALAMAKELGQTAGQPLNLREDYNRWYYPWNSWWGGSYGSQMAQNVIQNAGGEQPLQEDNNLALGQIAVSASVSIDFELK